MLIKNKNSNKQKPRVWLALLWFSNDFDIQNISFSDLCFGYQSVLTLIVKQSFNICRHKCLRFVNFQCSFSRGFIFYSTFCLSFIFPFYKYLLETSSWKEARKLVDCKHQGIRLFRIQKRSGGKKPRRGKREEGNLDEI